jgi:hypothetical protein
MTRACCVLPADCRGRRNLPVHDDADPARLGRPERVLQLPVEVGVSQHQHHTKRLHSRRCGCHLLPKRLHPIRNPARSSSAPPLLGPEFRYYFRFSALEPRSQLGLARTRIARHRVWSAPSRGDPRRTWAGPKWRAFFFSCASHPRRLGAACKAKTVFAVVSCSLSRLLFCCGDVTY